MTAGTPGLVQPSATAIAAGAVILAAALASGLAAAFWDAPAGVSSSPPGTATEAPPHSRAIERCDTAAPRRDPAACVDPFIGTGAHGHTFPGATLPFGMVQLSPDTRLEGWDGSSGYHDSDRVIFGFSHTHLSGTGIPDYGDVLLMPITGEARLANGAGLPPGAGYSSPFDKSTERAEAGWYAVTLAGGDIEVELTSTERTGWHVYRFPSGAAPHVVVDLSHRDTLLDSALRVSGPAEIEGFRRSTGWAADQVVHFVARFSEPFAAARIEGPRGVVSFSTAERAPRRVVVKVGISTVDISGARRNLEAESPGWDFDAVRRSARRRWNEALARIEVSGGTSEQRVIFYTALYHALIAPNVFSDVDGRYRGMDRRIHQAEGRRHYTVFSLWDTFRAEHPLLALIEPRRTAEFIATFLAQHREGGRLPVWELAGNETDTMIGYHAVPVLVDSWVKGAGGLSRPQAEAALDAMVHDAELDRAGLAAYRRQGFIGSDDASESVSRTLEYGYDDFCIARMAADLGRDEIAEKFFRRAQAWRHLFDPGTGFMRPRAAQRWLEPFDPRRVDNNFTEANAWQYRFFVPHDLEGLLEAMGGDQPFSAQLDALFDADSATTGREQADITGLIGQYAHGNEPSHHMAWLYHYAGRPALSARRVRRIVDTLYAAAPGGLAGNEDCGQMSAWYVLAAMGLYPVCPCTEELAIVPPLFERITVRPDGGRPFTIRAQDTAAHRARSAAPVPARSAAAFLARDVAEAGPRAGIEASPDAAMGGNDSTPARPEGGAAAGSPRFIAAARLDGLSLSRSFLRHREIARGGSLDLTVGPHADPAWGVSPADRPASRVPGDRVLPAPFVRKGDLRFRDPVTVELGCAEPGVTIRYEVQSSSDTDGHTCGKPSVTVGGAGPGTMSGDGHGTGRAAGPVAPSGWTVYSSPFQLDRSTRLRMMAERGALRSPVVVAPFHRLPHDWSIRIDSTPNPQYTAGGPDALIDGLRGLADWRTGAWHGYQGTDFLATVDLGEPRPIRRAGAGFLQDVRSWIWMPKEVIVSVSRDGVDFEQVARILPGVDDRDTAVTLRDLVEATGSIQARWVRVRAVGYGAIPSWHPGHGGEAFIFVDEVLVQ